MQSEVGEMSKKHLEQEFIFHRGILAVLYGL